jgi:hypothetical protein
MGPTKSLRSLRVISWGAAARSIGWTGWATEVGRPCELFHFAVSRNAGGVD